MNRAVLQLALVGAGRMGRTHLRALAGSQTVRMCDVAEPAPAVRAELAAAGWRVHASLEDLLAGGAPDAVLIAAPTHRHAALIRTAAEAGLPVLCEKPAGPTWQQVESSGRAAAAAGVPLQVAYWRRFVPELSRLREEIAAGRLGQVLHVQCAQWDAAPPPAAFRAGSGGIFVDMGVHEFDQVRWLTGQNIVQVRAVATPAVDPQAGPDLDNAQALLGLSGGATGLASLGRHHPGGDLVSVEVFGTRGHRRVEVLDPAGGEVPMLEALARQAESFARFVATGRRGGAGIDDAVVAMRAADQAATSLG